jgi:hypothetical protein
MPPIDPATCLKLLVLQGLKSLDDLPEAQGIYALADHRGALRDIGMTVNASFRKRIYNRHVTGSEGNSHKFACAYNVGRMWYKKKCSDQDPTDGFLARRLRQVFIRRHCRAMYVPLQLKKAELQTRESGALNIARIGMRDWNGKRFWSQPEPRELVDSIIEDLGWSSANCGAIERQAKLYDLHGR